MKISVADFLYLHSEGIDLFVKAVEHVFEIQSQADPSVQYRDVVLSAQRDIREYGEAKDRLARTTPPAPPEMRKEPLVMPLGELMDRRICRSKKLAGCERYVVYVVRDGEAVLYVGVTNYDARSRLVSHRNTETPLGKALRRNPRAGEWSVEMIAHPDSRSAREKEKVLIIQYQPKYNRKY